MRLLMLLIYQGFSSRKLLVRSYFENGFNTFFPPECTEFLMLYLMEKMQWLFLVCQGNFYGIFVMLQSDTTSF